MSRPAVVAHRGFAGVAPENTLGAVRRALEDEACGMVEVDVQPAADGTPVVIHDGRLEGDAPRDGRPLTDAEGYVWETPLEAVRAAEVLESGESVPTLAALLEALPATAGVNVELKNPGTPDLRPGEALPASDREGRREVWTPFVERVLEECAAFDGDLLFSSFCEGALAALRELEPAYAAAVLVGDSVPDGLEVARRYDCEAIHPPLSAVVGDAAGDSDPDVLEVAHEEGRAVNAWTVTTWVEFSALAAAGVDGIIADYPGLERWGAGDSSRR